MKMNKTNRQTKLLSSATVFFIVVSIVLSSAHTVAAQGLSDITVDDIIEISFTFVFGENIPRHWLNWRSFMQLIVLPFIAIFAVSYGIMNEIEIFKTDTGKKVCLVVAAIMALTAGRVLMGTMRGILIVNTWLATIGFGLILVVGIVVWILLRLLASLFRAQGGISGFR